MKFSATILFSLFCLSVYSQEDPYSGYTPIKGEGYFLRDAQGRIITDESGGVLSIIHVEDTASANLVLAPDTFQVFNITMVNPGDESTPPLATGVQAYWSLEETTGGTAFDSAASYDGTLINTPTQSETGISNLCYSFAAASNEYINFGTSFYDPGIDDVSVSAWVNISSSGKEHGIVGNWGTYPYWYIRVGPSRNVYGIVNFTGVNIETISNAISLDEWHYIVYRLDRDGNATLHIDNVLQGDEDDISAHSAVNLANANTHSIGMIGNIAAPYYCNGLIDEVSVYDRLLSGVEISNLYNVGAGKFWPYGVIGGDTLNMALSGEDTRSDSVRVLWKYESYPTTRVDGNLAFAFNMDDVADYYDTNFVHDEIGDTTEWWAAFTGFNDDWTESPNVDTVLIDSSDQNPPIQDVGVWDTIFYQDLEHHTSLPKEYTHALWSPDWNAYNDWRASDNRWPSGWQGVCVDSLIVDPITGSNVMKFNFKDTIIQGYDCQGSNTAGDRWHTLLGGNYDEVYVSFNIMARPGLLWSSGGKLGPGPMGGTEFPHGQGPDVPGYGQGFTSQMIWEWESYNEGAIDWYLYYQDQSGTYGDLVPWGDFQPEGEGLTGNYNVIGNFIYPVTDSVWYNFTSRCVVNSFTGETPNYDGILEGYVNGHLIERHTGLYLITYPDINMAMDRFGFSNFFGGGGPALRDEWFLIDDVVVFVYDESVDVPRGNEVSPPGRVLNLPNWPKQAEE